MSDNEGVPIKAKATGFNTKPISGFKGNVAGFDTTKNNNNDTPTTGGVIEQERPPVVAAKHNFPNPAGGKTLAGTEPVPEKPIVQKTEAENMLSPVQFQVLSDLHMEQARPKWDYDHDILPAAPFLVLAGDIGNCIRNDNLDRYFTWLVRHVAKFERVFVVLGNNEPKGKGAHKNGWDASISRIRGWAAHPYMGGGLTFLENNMYDLKDEHQHDVIVLGCTLWSRIRDDQSTTAGRSDASGIKGWGPSPKKNNEVFENSYRWLKNQVSEIRGGDRKSARILVITHHAPCFGTSTPNQDKLGDSWSAYQNDILGGEGVEGLRRGDAWVFGHTHFCCDFTRDEVRVYANQRGRGAEVRNYDERKTITI